MFSCSSENNESNKNVSALPSNNQSEELTFSDTEILNTDVNCEEFDTHVYCISKTAPVAKKYPKWGALTGYSPEVFCSTDLPLLVCTETAKSLLAAMMEWGSYGNAEYWICLLYTSPSPRDRG